jgi:hypothetical protein
LRKEEHQWLLDVINTACGGGIGNLPADNTTTYLQFKDTLREEHKLSIGIQTSWSP